MNVKELYEIAGGSYEEMILNLGKEERIIKFLKMFPQENIVANIDAALKAQDYQTAFRNAHNLKGMSINIGLKKLHSVSSDLTESLRNGPTGNIDELYKIVAEEYEKTCKMINEL